MSSETWKLEKDLCRCCHAEGSFTSLAERARAPPGLQQDDILSEMLRRCFVIDICPVEGMYSASTYTICEPCILWLRDASNFKQQVLQCEERFRDMFRNVEALGDINMEEEEENNIEYEFKEEYFETSDDEDAVAADDAHDDAPLPKQPKPEINDDETDQVKPQNEIKGPEEISNTSTDVKTREVNALGDIIVEEEEEDIIEYEFKEDCFEMSDYEDVVAADDALEDAPLAKQTRVETNDDETDQVKPQKEMKGPEEITSDIDLNKNTATDIKTRKVNGKGATNKSYHLRKRNQTPKISQNVFICNDCGKRFGNKCTLAVHIGSHEKLKTSNYLKCEECPYHTETKVSLEQHSKLHDENRCFICDTCGYTAEKKYILLNHLKRKNVHSDTLQSSNIYAPLPKQSRLETSDDDMDQVKPRKKLKGPEEITSNFDLNKNTATDIKTRKVHGKGSTNKSYHIRKRNQTHKILQNVSQLLHTTFICNDCGKRFGNKCTLAVHIGTHEKLKQANNLKSTDSLYQTQVSLDHIPVLSASINGL